MKGIEQVLVGLEIKVSLKLGNRGGEMYRGRVQKLRLGDILITAGLLTEEQLQNALHLQKLTKERLGEILVRQNFVTEQDIMRVLSQQLGLQYIDLNNLHLDPRIATIIPEHVAYKHQVLPLRKEDNRLLLAMVDPLNLLAIDDIEILTNLTVQPAITGTEDLNKKLAEIFQNKGVVDRIVKDLDNMYANNEIAAIQTLEQETEDIPVVRLVNSLFQQAVWERASDIHMEPQENEVIVRFRIDGVLIEKMSWPKRLYASIVSRIKIIGEMDIAERRLPQDGRSETKVDNKDVDLRISTLPTIWGERVVIRLLLKENVLVKLEQLGFSAAVLPKLVDLYNKPYGMLLVTGPTGSGKTTTLYSILKELNSAEKNILTIEDPVEYQLDRINQVQVNQKARLNFTNALRAFLRQDPDIIMIGELRDEETVRIGIQSALTGHFVLSTLHTNDTAGTVSRLLDMGIEPFLITSSLLGVVSQRLARKICPHCKEAYLLEPEMVEKIGLQVPDPTQVVVYQGKGCPQCGGTGYLGRVALGEILIVSEEIRRLIIARASTDEIRKQALQEGLVTLYQSGVEKLLAGVTTVQELFRVTISSL